MTKKELRAYYLEKRSKLDSEEVLSNSKLISHLLINLISSVNSKKVHSFLPIPNSKEVDVWPVLEHCWKNKIKTATSITHFKPKRLEHTWIEKETKFSKGIYNTLLPSPIQSVNLQELELVIIPLLCIDKFGNRIGYGQGFYDSFLSQLSPETKKVGVSFFEPVNETIIADHWDVPLTHLATPSDLIHF